MLERLEREPVERIDPDAAIDPPKGCEDEEVAEALGESEAVAEEEPQELEAAGRRAAKPGIPVRSARTAGRHGRWTRADAVVLMLAVGVLGLSLWAIQWLAALGRA
jgi:hypothetical protein